MTTINDFTILEKLGEGTFSSVYKGKILNLVQRNSDNNFYALKKVKIHQLKQKEKENSLNEVRILASINCPHIIKYKEAFIEEQNLCIVMELADMGDLLKKIKKAQSIRQLIPEKEIWLVLHHIVIGKVQNEGLAQLHQMKILHRDLKGANIFVKRDQDQQPVYLIGDLNVSKIAKDELAMTQTGTPYYASPEVWMDKPYDFSSDIWSLGCIIYELCSLNPPFFGKDMQALYKKVCSGQYKPIPKIYSKELSDIIQTLLQVEPKNRPSCHQILKNESIQSRFNYQTNEQTNRLLDTIRFPLNILNLNKQLPSAQYLPQQKIQIKQDIPQNIKENYFQLNKFNPNKIKINLERLKINSSKNLDNDVNYRQKSNSYKIEIPKIIQTRNQSPNISINDEKKQNKFKRIIQDHGSNQMLEDKLRQVKQDIRDVNQKFHKLLQENINKRLSPLRRDILPLPKQKIQILPLSSKNQLSPLQNQLFTQKRPTSQRVYNNKINEIQNQTEQHQQIQIKDNSNILDQKDQQSQNDNKLKINLIKLSRIRNIRVQSGHQNQNYNLNQNNPQPIWWG